MSSQALFIRFIAQTTNEQLAELLRIGVACIFISVSRPGTITLVELQQKMVSDYSISVRGQIQWASYKKKKSGIRSPDWNVSIINIHLWKPLWAYCPGHAGVKGNGWADTLEGNGTLTSSLLLGAKCWGAWDTTWGHKAKDTTPSITWRREVWYEEELMICLKKMREGHCNFLYCFKGNTGKASEDKVQHKWAFLRWVHRIHLEVSWTVGRNR